MHDVALSGPQSEFFISKQPYVAAVAGFGSGKTHVAVTKILSTKLQYPRIDLAYLAPTYPLIRDIFYPAISDVLESMGAVYKINQSKHIVYIQGYGKIYCRTMEKPENIVGWECGDAFLDEFDVLKLDKALHVMRKIKARCRQKFPDGKINQVHVTTTPEGYKATYQLFKREPLEGSQLIQMSTYSNEKNLPDDYISDLRAMYPEQLIAAYLMGEFTNLQVGSVYPGFDRNDNHFSLELGKNEIIHTGFDFNVYKGASAMSVVRDGSVYFFDETYDAYDTIEQTKIINERYPNHKKVARPDASGDNMSSSNTTSSDIKQLKDAGFQVKVPRKNPLIKNRVSLVNGKIKNSEGQITMYVDTNKCPRLTEALEQQIYTDSGQPDKSSGLDHIADAVGYNIWGLYSGVGKIQHRTNNYGY